jgi:hypothetical protein
MAMKLRTSSSSNRCSVGLNGSFPLSHRKVADVDAEHLRRLVEPASGYAVDALLILVGLLESDPDEFRELVLAETEHDPPFSDALADMPVDILQTTASALSI